MPEIDWSKAPDDATHYSPETCDWLPCWVKQEGTAWFVRPTNRTVDPGSKTLTLQKASHSWSHDLNQRLHGAAKACRQLGRCANAKTSGFIGSVERLSMSEKAMAQWLP